MSAVDIREEFADVYAARRNVAIRELRGRLAWHDVGKRLAGLCATFLANGMDERARELASTYMRIQHLTSERYDRHHVPAERAS